MRGGACEGILIPLPQHVHDFVRGIEIQDLAEGLKFDSVLSLLAVRHSKDLNWAVNSCLGWYRFELWTGVEWNSPAYRGHGRKIFKREPCSPSKCYDLDNGEDC